MNLISQQIYPVLIAHGPETPFGVAMRCTPPGIEYGQSVSDFEAMVAELRVFGYDPAYAWRVEPDGSVLCDVRFVASSAALLRLMASHPEMRPVELVDSQI